MSARISVVAHLPLAARLVPADRLEAREKRGRLSTGVGPLDQLLTGGWPRGALSELAGARGSGRTTLVLASLAAALGCGESAALLDVNGTLDPHAAVRSGIPLERLLWVRCTADKALPAADIVLGTGGLGLVAIDWGDVSPRVPTGAWLRLKRVAEQQGTAVLVASQGRFAGALGACAVRLTPVRARFEGGRPAPLLTALHIQASVERGAPGAEAATELEAIHQPR